MKAGVYARISNNPEQDELGVKRQVKAAKELVSGRRGTVVMSCVDNDISATKGAHRPEYERLMAAAEAGRITHLVVFHTSRLWRNRRERAEGIERLARARVSVVCVKGADLDLSSASGRALAGIIGEMDTWESEVKSERILAKVEELAQAGKIANGGPRPFGYRRSYAGEGPRRKILSDEIEPTEAAIVSDCAERFLDGESLRSIVGDLNQRGIPTSTGGKWSMQGLRLLLRSGRIAGLREHRRQVIGKAVWPAIISEDLHRELRARLDAQGRHSGGPRVRTHHLTGFVYCSGCGVRMGVKPQHGGKLKYVCPPKQEGGCNGRVIVLTDLEELVAEYMAGRLSDPLILDELARWEATEDTGAQKLVKQIQADQRRLEVLTDQLTDGDETEVPEVAAAIRKVRARLQQAREGLASRPRVPAVLREDLPGLAKRWRDLDLDRKRALLALFVDRIVIGPARRGLGRFDPSRVDITPRKWS